MTATFFLRQAWLAPLAMLLPIVTGAFTPEHDSLAQHMSAMTLLEGWPAYSVKIGAIICGVSILIFAAGCLLLRGGLAWSFTAMVSAAFGIAMVFNGLFPMGSPLHGLYGLAIFSVLVPAFYVAEFGKLYDHGWLVPLSLAASTLGLGYMWGLLVGLEPPHLAGLTQRLFTVISFGWFAVVSQLNVKAGA